MLEVFKWPALKLNPFVMTSKSDVLTKGYPSVVCTELVPLVIMLHIISFEVLTITNLAPALLK